MMYAVKFEDSSKGSPVFRMLMDGEAATLIADALDIVNPDDEDAELSARDLATAIRSVVDEARS